MTYLALWPRKTDSHSETAISQNYKNCTQNNYLLNVSYDCNYIHPVR